MWSGMTLGVWLKLLAGNRFAVQPKRLGMAAATTCFSTGNSVFRLMSEALHRRRAGAVELEHPPLFVVGHWRSGTTLLHELLVLDERFNYPTTLQCMIPHHFALTEAFINRTFGWLTPGKREMDNMAFGPDRPQEDEIALCNLGAPSPYRSWAYPHRMSVPPEYLDFEGLSATAVEQWKATMLFFLRRLALKDVRRRRIVLKSPTHTARIRTLLELFPQAQFVHITRDPFVVFLSTMRTWKSLSELLSFTKVDQQVIEEQVFTNFERMYRSFFRDLDLLKPGQFHQVRYEDLVKNPTGTVQSIYEQLELGDFAAVRPRIEEFFRDSQDYRPNQYKFNPELYDKILARWGEHIQALGYAPEGGGPTRHTISSTASVANGLS